MKRKVIICGGGSGGHVLPAITVIRKLREIDSSLDIICFGSYKGIEAKLFPPEGVQYYPISTGKLRRYFSWQNFTDLFRIARGVVQASSKLFSYSKRESVVFCTGGFVTVPVAFSAWLQGKSVYIHEQTSRVGLANKICSLFAEKVMITFEDSINFYPKNKTVLTGYPLRSEIFTVPKLEIDHGDRPILFLTGGGNGSSLLNSTLFGLLKKLGEKYFVIHQCGKNEFDKYKKEESENYRVFDFVGKEMISLLDQASVVISRSGAGTVVELMSLGKPSIFIPLKIAQKNEQFYNAKEAQNALGSLVIEEKDLNEESLLNAIERVGEVSRKEKYKSNPVDQIVEILLEKNHA